MTEAQQQALFEKVSELLRAYAPPYQVREGRVQNKRSLELWAEGDFEVFGKRRKEIYFGGVIIQKGYVGFYFMPVYSDEAAMRRIFSERLLHCLKGKSCFYLKRMDPQMEEDIAAALKAGYELYVQRGWV